MQIAVMIPTFRRPALLVRLLESLVRECGAEGLPPIYVIDNDQPAAKGAAAAIAWASTNSVSNSVHCVSAPLPGLANCRNAGIEHIFSDQAVDAVAMVDDDAYVAPGWFDAARQAVEAGDADIIGGPTLYLLPPGCPQELRTAPVFGVPYSESGPVPVLRSSNNCIILRSAYNAVGSPLFNRAFNRTGGEDTLFFRLAQKRGLRFKWSANMSVYEPVPVERATHAWVMSRHKLSATNAARIDIELNGIILGSATQAFLAVKEVLSGLYWLASPTARDTVKAAYRIDGAIARITGVFGTTRQHH